MRAGARDLAVMVVTAVAAAGCHESTFDVVIEPDDVGGGGSDAGPTVVIYVSHDHDDHCEPGLVQPGDSRGSGDNIPPECGLPSCLTGFSVDSGDFQARVGLDEFGFAASLGPVFGGTGRAARLAFEGCDRSVALDLGAPIATRPEVEWDATAERMTLTITSPVEGLSHHLVARSLQNLGGATYHTRVGERTIEVPNPCGKQFVLSALARTTATDGNVTVRVWNQGPSLRFQVCP